MLLLFMIVSVITIFLHSCFKIFPFIYNFVFIYMPNIDYYVFDEVNYAFQI